MVENIICSKNYRNTLKQQQYWNPSVQPKGCFINVLRETYLREIDKSWEATTIETRGSTSILTFPGVQHIPLTSPRTWWMFSQIILFYLKCVNSTFSDIKDDLVIKTTLTIQVNALYISSLDYEWCCGWRLNRYSLKFCDILNYIYCTLSFSSMFSCRDKMWYMCYIEKSTDTNLD